MSCVPESCLESENKHKRFRATNFSSEEKHLIFTLVEKYKNIIENKKTDGTTCHDKFKTWQKIENEFNTSSPNSCRRSAESLKKFYYNKKEELRKTAAEERKETILTGGGLAKKIRRDDSHDLLLSLMGEKTVYGLTNNFDCDCESIPSTSREIHSLNNSELEKDTNDEMDTLQIIEEATMEFQDTVDSANVDMNVTNNSTNNKAKFSSTDASNFKGGPASHQSFAKKNWKGLKESKEKKYITRRRPTTVVRALTSSDIAEKYKLLIEKRLAIAERDLDWGREKALLEKENLMLDIAIKKETLKQLQSHQN